MYVNDFASIDERLALKVTPKKMKMTMYERNISKCLKVPRKIFPFGEYYEIAISNKYLLGCYPYQNTFINYVIPQ
jgi:hypothetical protein